MPRYYFNVDGTPDLEGVKLAALADAKRDAIKTAGQIIADEAGAFWVEGRWGMTVTDEKGLTLFHIEVVGTDAPVVMTIDPRLGTSA